jgi:uncharacterized LabA/DUF88 family protein
MAMAEQRRLALLIDGDNAQASLLGQMLAETSKYGVVTIRRVYGDWTTPEMKSWKQALHVYALQPVQQFRYTAGKNATDSAMIIDAMDVLYTAGVDGFCLVSSDSDYTRLATRIREKNLFVMGIGKQTTPRAFVNACDVFVYTENLQAEEVAAASPEASPTPVVTTPAGAPPPESRDTPLKQLFKTAFELSVQENGWALLSVMGNKLRQLDPGFDPRTYGHRQLLLLVQAHPELFDIKRTKKAGKTNITVRLREGV